VTINVVVADDHPVVLDGLRHVAANANVAIVSHVQQLERMEETVRRFQPEVLITEVRIGGQDALKTLETLRDRLPRLPVVVFSGFVDSTHIARAAALGCADYVAKTSPSMMLFEAVRNAANGRRAPAGSLMAMTKSRMRRPQQVYDHDVPLTNREMQVLEHISMGLSNREIGKSLAISIETVKEHVQNIFRKLDVNDRTQAALWAVNRGLVRG
jgi:DNA-binding NarL/FixJ family response regulator